MNSGHGYTEGSEENKYGFPASPDPQIIEDAENNFLKSPPNKSAACTLTNEELIEKANEWIRKLCTSGGRDWCLSIPARHNVDPDLILSEVVDRFKNLIDKIKTLSL
jgi:hypothetical protein